MVFLPDLFEGKDVGIAGGGPTNEEALADCDIVVRINNHWARQQGKCDIIYSGGEVDVEIPEHCMYVAINGEGPAREQNIAAAGLSRAPLFTFYNRIHGETNPFGPEHEWLNIYNKTLGTMAFTGFVALRHISMMPCNAIYLTGFTFYKDADGNIPATRDAHDNLAHMEWLKRECMVDARLCMDEQLATILEGKYGVQPFKRMTQENGEWSVIETPPQEV